MALFALGFRPFYLLGAVFAALSVFLWVAEFSGHFSYSAQMSGVVRHSHEMVFGFVPAILAGFLFTAVRNWTGLPTPAGAALAVTALLWLLARVLVVTGPGPIAVIVDVLFLPVVAAAIAVPIVRGQNQRNYKVVALVAVLAALHIGYHAGFSRPSLFAFLDVMAILFALIGGRVILAFTRNAIPGSDPRYLPWLEWMSFGSLILVAALTLFGSLLPNLGSLPMVLLVIAAVSQLLRLALWQPQKTLGDPLLWMLPVAYSWLPLALFLRALATTGAVMPGTWLHALAAGAFSGLMMAMMMRSSLGHTGRPLDASTTDMAAFLLLQAGAVLRIVAGAVFDYRLAVIAAGIVWALAFVLFLLRYAPMLTQARADGKPG